MFFAGKNIQSSSDRLIKINVDYLYRSIKNPRTEIVAKIKQLRIIRDLDKKRYAYLKKQLPYIVCGAFNPPFRRLENFVYIEHFIVDIDHLSEKSVNINTLKSVLMKDNRLCMMFISPGEDGLKLLFNLKERCTDSGIYSVFYKKFINALSLQYNLEQVIDTCTSDVSRACFISMDFEAYYNPNAQAVDINDFINIEDTFALFESNRKSNKEEKKREKQVREENKLPKDPDNDTLTQIKQMLGTKMRLPKEKREIFVPERLNDIIDGLTAFIQEQGIIV
ncbi:MAG: virulence protein E, partial [Bacteroidales bacterium]|nr:virulence protein E [Bacteroidales bacterium]